MEIKDGSWARLVIGLEILVISLAVAIFGRTQNPELQAFINVSLIIMGMAGSAMILSWESLKLMINKSADKISIIKLRIFKKEVKLFKVSEVLKIEFRQKYINQSRIFQPKLQSQLFFVFKNGKEVGVDKIKVSGSFSENGLTAGSEAEKELAVGTEIAHFLNVPVETINPKFL